MLLPRPTNTADAVGVCAAGDAAGGTKPHVDYNGVAVATRSGAGAIRNEGVRDRVTVKRLDSL